jgi:tetratricopeptide (TPR) repeat protein
MNRVRYTEWIDSYIGKELDEAAKKKFELELSINQDLAVEYHLDLDLEKILSQQDLLDFRAKCILSQNELNLSTRKFVKVVQFTRKYWYAAASILLIAIVAGSLILLNPGGYSPEKLFKMYYKSGESIGVSRSGKGNMVEALLLFSKNDYQAADILFDKILAKDPRNFAVMYYSGISNIEMKNYPKAIQMFETIIADKDNLYIENADWYLGLSYLASDNLEQASKVFSTIAETPGHYYTKDAKSILEKISKSEKNKKFLNNLFFLILPF